MPNGPPATEVLSGKCNQMHGNLLIVWLLNRRPSSFPECVQEFAIQWKMGDYGNGSLRLIFTALYISKGLLILRVLLPPLQLLQSSTQASSTDCAPTGFPASPHPHWTVQGAPKPDLPFLLILPGNTTQFPCSQVGDERVKQEAIRRASDRQTASVSASEGIPGKFNLR